MQKDDKKANSKSGSSKWYLGSAAALLLLKGKSLLALLKFGKFGGALISMATTIGFYALLYPWGFAVGFVLLLFVHELGHVWAAKRKGLPVSAPLFIPFLGALITMKRHPLDAQTEAYVAMGGPLLGTVGAMAVYAGAYATDSPLLYALAYVGFFLNLLNLLPIHPLDGGRISTAVSRWLWLVGLVGGIVVIVYLKSFLFFLIWALFAYDLYKKYVKRNKGEVKVQSLLQKPLINVQHLYEQGYPLPGPEHTRRLSFNTYSDLEGQQYVTVYMESLDVEQTILLPQQCLVQHVWLNGVEHIPTPDAYQLKLLCEIDYIPFENDKYYEVPTSSRWKFGIGYLGLALFLMGMMYVVHQHIGDIRL
ncbi:Zn-dependent protease [Paenibacillus sp. RC254]|uniref:site-2 protease family protein n=1 Tax=unclassified Paenibacillus TaxID=185978 RepID=UPI0024B8AF78|nr:site-2 protease family protein [Paenibacillus sp. RC334]